MQGRDIVIVVYRGTLCRVLKKTKGEGFPVSVYIDQNFKGKLIKEVSVIQVGKHEYYSSSEGKSYQSYSHDMRPGDEYISFQKVKRKGD